jgi:hypothetical protein
VVHPSKTTPSQAALRVKQWLIEEAAAYAAVGIAADPGL